MVYSRPLCFCQTAAAGSNLSPAFAFVQSNQDYDLMARHPDTTTGPRVVLGSQRPRIPAGIQVCFRLPMQSNALRAEGGSRSANWAGWAFGGCLKMRPGPVWAVESA